MNDNLNSYSISNFQLLLKSDTELSYSGLDPLLFNTTKPFINGNYARERVIYDNFNSKYFFYLTGFFNIGPIVMDERSLPWFGYIGPDNQAIKKQFAEIDKKSKGKLIIWENMSSFKPLLQTSSTPWVILNN